MLNSHGIGLATRRDIKHQYDVARIQVKCAVIKQTSQGANDAGYQKVFVLKCCMLRSVTENFAVRYFTVGHFALGYFVVRKFRRK